MAELSSFLDLSRAKDSDVWWEHVPGSPLLSLPTPRQLVRGVLPLFGWGKVFPEDVFELLVEFTTHQGHSS